MKRPWHIAIGFGLCLAVVLAAMGWISLAAVRLDREAADARRRAAREESTRLALWRMDSTLAPLVAQESARPYFVYRPFLQVDRAFSRMYNNNDTWAGVIPSPLLTEVPPNILVHFQYDPDGNLTSPQVPLEESNYDLAVPGQIEEERMKQSTALLSRVATLTDRETLRSMLPDSTAGPMAMLVPPPLFQTDEQIARQQQERQSQLVGKGRGSVEYLARNQLVNSGNFMGQNAAANPFDTLLFPSTDVSGVLMTPLWLDGELVLARRISAGGQEYVQGCLLDWPAIKRSLLASIDDLLPEADLESVEGESAEEEGRMLAALPVRLIPGALIPGDPGAAGVGTEGPLSPMLLSLSAAWVCVLLAATAVAALLLGLLRLSERRAAFVTAVTHELRTPLTTFQMYAEMLAEGMVPDTTQQKRYLNTLRAESVRLTHLVENVLCYARLERGRPNGRLAEVTLGRLVEQVEDRLAGRAEHAGMELVVEADTAAGEARVRANVSAAEQVLFNLVDNACKYAANAEDKRIHLAMDASNGMARLSLRDHGPGLGGSARRQLFQPFSKTAHEAAHTAPGVGLGLALSRRLARDMGGDLMLDESIADGACFVLTLPAAEGDGNSSEQSP